MDLYHVWCDLRPGVRDLEFAARVETYLGLLRARGLIAGWRLSRRKLGFGPPGLGEFHLMIEVRDLAQLDAAFQAVARRAEPEEGAHAGVNQMVCNAVFGLARDFPDPGRVAGEERF